MFIPFNILKFWVIFIKPSFLTVFKSITVKLLRTVIIFSNPLMIIISVSLYSNCAKLVERDLRY
jgi:hypothetical protein